MPKRQGGEVTAGAEGWGDHPASRKQHYFRAEDSLCRKAGFYGGFRASSCTPKMDRCAECARRLKKEAKRSQVLLFDNAARRAD